jgi:aminoglycoside/choline kinase family phosphotransferase
MATSDSLKILFEKWGGEKLNSFSQLPDSGSNRKYFRLSGEEKKAIGAFNPNQRENKAFIYLTKHFNNSNLPVPKFYMVKMSIGIYLQEDLGDETLFSLLNKKRSKNIIPAEVKNLYLHSISELPRFQIIASKGLDYSNCYPRATFDAQSIKWDLSYFKYYFLKLANISFDEQKLEDDFNTLAKFLLEADKNYFMYRDFNSRNIMIKDEKPFFIDYQGGRKGALQYDVASLLFDSKANLPIEFRNELLEHYLHCVNRIKKIDSREFKKYFSSFILIRLMQMFGAYGYRGFFEGKAHFLKSIPFALNNLEWLLNKNRPKVKTPELFNALNQVIHSKGLKKFQWTDSTDGKLTVRVNSFSYRKKLPADLSGNGGGFVFDCRAIPNPGRLDRYKQLTGRDKPVQDFLEAQPEAQKFLHDSFDIVKQSVENYSARGWGDLMVSFGCTGGQHRSVYSAEMLAKYLRDNYDILVQLTHTNL